MSKIQDAQRLLQKGGLQPGKHHKLQIAIVELFGPHFAPDSTVLYAGDVGDKPIIYEKETLQELGVPVTTHSKLPDIILYDKPKNLLYLIEAVTSHGPVSHKRLSELEKLLKNCIPKRIYISAFLDFAEYGRHKSKIAWETEVWIAEIPEHMIHYNGDRYMGQHG
jgi:type II restriction enzyme